jgi:hypothetical protein
MTDQTTIGLLKDALDAMKGVLEFFKLTRDLSKDDKEKAALGVTIESAEKKMRAAEAQIAQAFGYEICKCTYPPQIMLSVGHHPVHGNEMFSCAKCGAKRPTDHEIARMDARKNRSGRAGSSWMGN